MIDLPRLPETVTIVDGPIRVGNELRWHVTRADGEPAVLVQLVPELADDESVRRRYVYEAERLRDLAAPAVAPTFGIGPAPDPRDPAAAPPWRLRADPSGETLAAWLDRRAPAPADEAVALVATVADAVHGVHAAGAVLRDLEPRSVVLGSDGAVWLTDIGLARVDILSTRTASSLMLESSPYAAPEHLRATVVDPRADVYTLGAIAWHALAGEPPNAGGLFRTATALPPLQDVADVTSDLADFVARCLADDVDARPETARDVAEVLRGRAAVGSGTTALARIACQACGAALRPGMRLCVSCGKQAVQFTHVDADVPASDRYRVVLRTAKDDADFLHTLRAFFETVGEGPPPELNFLTGDARMYSRDERKRRTRLPVPLFSDLSEPVAEDLAERLRALGMKVRVERADRPHAGQRRAKRLMGIGLGSSVVGIGALIAGTFVTGGVLLGVGAVTTVAGAISMAVWKERSTEPMAQLRSAPAALPASDPLVARVAAPLSDDDLAADVRERVSELALLVQRLVDHRAAHAGSADVALVTEPVEPLVALIEAEVAAIATIDRNLADLDEGVIVRALATAEARGDGQANRAELLDGLDRLRSLEDARSQHMQRLLDAASLVRRTVELGLSMQDDDLPATRDRNLALALAGLDAEL